MSKSQHGNKEAKKPKQKQAAPLPVAPASTAQMPTLGAGPSQRTKKK
jgi:hypothetical protein